MAIIGIHGKIGSGKDTVGKMFQYHIDRKRNGYTNPSSLEDFNSYINNGHDLKCGWAIKKFAYALKQVCSIIFNISIEDLELPEVKAKFLNPSWYRYYFERQYTDADHNLYFKKFIFSSIEDADYAHNYITDGAIRAEFPTIRSFLQEIGTNAMRNVIHPDIWVNALMNKYAYNNPIFYEGGVESPDYEDISPDWIITDVRFKNEVQAIKRVEGIIIKIIRTDVPENFSSKHISENELNNYKFDYDIINNGSMEDLLGKTYELLNIISNEHPSYNI